MKREDLLKSKDYVVPGIQLQLLNLIEEYMKANKLNRTQLANKLKVDKSYISQLLNVSYDHKISKFVELSLSCDMMPLVFFVEMDRFIKNDSDDKIYAIHTVQRPKNVTYSDITRPFLTKDEFKNTKYKISSEVKALAFGASYSPVQ